MMRKRRLRPAVIGAGAAAVIGLAACAPMKPPSQLQFAVFECDSGPQTWVVPPGVTGATFDIYGAQGGAGAVVNTNAGGVGGLGGRALATLPVSPGESIEIDVGCEGADGVAPTGGGAGGFGGGGTGGAGQDSPPSGGGGGGGGASDVRRGGSALANRVLVAAGGGAGGAARDAFVGPIGGAGGYPFGEKGGNDGGGGGGNQSSGGVSGDFFADPGALGVGADGTDNGGIGAGGGGGGGGLYGGGGGDGGDGAGTIPTGGGGGGSSGAPGAPGGFFEDAVRSGDGVVIIAYQLS